MAKKLTQEEFQQFVVEQFGALRTEVRDGFIEVHREIDAIKATLEPLSNAFDKDAETLVEHDRRIGRVEKHLGLGHA
jgi:hypothetical protein